MRVGSVVRLELVREREVISVMAVNFSGRDGGKEGGFFLLGDNHWCAGGRRRGNNLLNGFAVNKGEVLLYGELWRGGHREI